MARRSVGDISEVFTCSICMCGHSENNRLIALQPCGHICHENCILEWLEHSNQANLPCPFCRVTLGSPRYGAVFWPWILDSMKEDKKTIEKLRRDATATYRFIKVLQHKNIMMKRDLEERTMDLRRARTELVTTKAQITSLQDTLSRAQAPASKANTETSNANGSRIAITPSRLPDDDHYNDEGDDDQDDDEHDDEHDDDDYDDDYDDENGGNSALPSDHDSAASRFRPNVTTRLASKRKLATVAPAAGERVKRQVKDNESLSKWPRSIGDGVGLFLPRAKLDPSGIYLPRFGRAEEGGEDNPIDLTGAT